MNAVTKAIEACGLSGLATQLGVTYQAVRKFERTGVPAERVLPIVRATKGSVTPHELRSDIYPDPNWLPPDLNTPPEASARADQCAVNPKAGEPALDGGAA